MAGMDAQTGRPLAGWDHVLQSLVIIFSTRIGERVMRRWFGSNVPGMLGRNMTPPTYLRFLTALYTAVTLWEPRYRIIRISVLTAERDGATGLLIEGEYMPRGHLGDFTVERPASVRLAANDNGSFVAEAA